MKKTKKRVTVGRGWLVHHALFGYGRVLQVQDIDGRPKAEIFLLQVNNPDGTPMAKISVPRGIVWLFTDDPNLRIVRDAAIDVQETAQ